MGTVRRGWFPSKHTTCKRQLPDTRPHQAIVTVSSSPFHLPFQPVFPTSSDPPRVVVPRYARLNVPLSLTLSLSLLPPFGLLFHERALIRKDPVSTSFPSRRGELDGDANRKKYPSSFFHSSAPAGYVYTHSCYVFLSSTLSLSFFLSLLAGSLSHCQGPAWPRGACWAQVRRPPDRNPTSYTLLNHRTCVYCYPSRRETIPYPAPRCDALSRFLSAIDQSFSGRALSVA